MTRVLSFLITFWAGSLWTICGLVAPSLFAVLEDRHMAGQLAARFFRAEAFIGLIIGVTLLVLTTTAATSLSTGRARALIATTVLLPLISQFALGPLLERARIAGDMSKFGMLHGVAAALFLAACISALFLVWQFSRRAE